MNIVSLFSGIGAFEKALTNLNIVHNVVNYCEVDKYASESYSAIHGIDKSLNLGDITQIDITKLENGCADLITYGFPCQDISNAGKQKGFQDENGNLTRSGLFFYASAIIGRIQPKIAICENVKALVGKKFEKEFKIVLDTLDEMGYNNYWQVLNAKDYGIPQNRERVFVVSVRKDIDKGEFNFPKPFNLEKKLADMLEQEVDEKYYLDGKYETISKVNDNYSLLCGGIIGKMHDVSRRVYSSEYVAPTLHTCGGGNLEPKVAVGTIIEDFYRNREERIYRDASPVIRADRQGLKTIDADLRIRKLTPKECWRLMGFDDKDVEKAQAVGISNTQLYKQAGNSIVVNVLMEIFKQLHICKLI